MKIVGGEMRLAATDVSNHLACHHLTHLELSAARGERERPQWEAPDLVVIRELGLRHEARYLSFLAKNGLDVLNLGTQVEDLGSRAGWKPALPGDEGRIVQETLRAMEGGVEVIAQGALRAGRWFGRPDLLRKVPRASRFGNWSYEAYDCKLARETKATTILQLAFYSELLGEIQRPTSLPKQTRPAAAAPDEMQGKFSWDETQSAATESLPEFMWVVPPGKAFEAERYRVAEYAAYYRYVKGQLEKVCDDGAAAETYPEPCAHCDVCRWFRECEARRRADDHLSLVAGIRRQQRDQLEVWSAETMAKLAVLPIPLKQKPLHGSREAIEKVREQARVQVEARTRSKLVHEALLPVVEGTGYCRLPEPSPGDVFVDLEGDPFAGDPEAGCGQQYLFGLATAGDDGSLRYQKRWAFTADEEKSGFEWFVDEVMGRLKKFPAMHVYHFGAYEPAAFKNLMGRYATREDEIDRMLRAGLFVDLHTIFKQALRASVEEYSLKKLEVFYGFKRKVPLEESRAAMRYVEHRLELGWAKEELPERFREAMEGYNGEDCFSTAALRDWLEIEREKLVKDGKAIARPAIEDGAAPEDVDARQQRVAELVKNLTDGISADPQERSEDDKARWLLAAMLDWHRREDKATWWEYYKLRDMKDEDLLEERQGLAGLKHIGQVRLERKLPVERYRFPKQETDVRRGDKVCQGEMAIGKVEEIDIASRTIVIKKTNKSAGTHPTAIFVDGRGPKWEVLADSLFALGEWARGKEMDSPGPHRAARDLLLRSSPRLEGKEKVAPLPGETPVETACRIVTALNDSVFAIQGPPGAGKTHTAAWMICRLASMGKKIGITALSHKVIRNVLEKVLVVADELEMKGIRCVQKAKEDGEDAEAAEIAIAKTNQDALQALQSGRAQVGAGTVWMWARPEFANAVDVLLIDEAGQMAVADVLAAARSAKKLVLIGDPQQLQRPLKGSHPDGAEKSALQHLIGEHKTIADGMGLLLPETWRMHPKVCEFTSEMFYEGKLGTRPVTRPRVLEGHAWVKDAGIWFVPLQHTGNRNSSAEEVEKIAEIVASLLKPGVKWFCSGNVSRQVKLEDVLIVAPYNAQVSDLAERLPGARVGTVDKFQGQEAPVVIYSLTTSTPEDAPRGMEFLYSLNRFNVATSRAMTAVIVVGSPRLFEPECKSPRQMQLANAFCAYLERATVVEW
jgi:predicted RecB family nuclease